MKQVDTIRKVIRILTVITSLTVVIGQLIREIRTLRRRGQEGT